MKILRRRTQELQESKGKEDKMNNWTNSFFAINGYINFMAFRTGAYHIKLKLHVGISVHESSYIKVKTESASEAVDFAVLTFLAEIERQHALDKEKFIAPPFADVLQKWYSLALTSPS